MGFTFKVVGKEGYQSFPDHCKELRAMGFKRHYHSRAGGVSTTSYEKEYGTKKIDVQLWGDGKHRAARWNKGKYGWMHNQTPTEFVTIEEMKVAIQTQLDLPVKK